jgi:hypothetical protein
MSAAHVRPLLLGGAMLRLSPSGVGARARWRADHDRAVWAMLAGGPVYAAAASGP